MEPASLPISSARSRRVSEINWPAAPVTPPRMFHHDSSNAGCIRKNESRCDRRSRKRPTRRCRPTSRSAPARSYPHSHSHHTPSNPAEATREINTALPGLHSPAPRRLAVAGQSPHDLQSRNHCHDPPDLRSNPPASRRLAVAGKSPNDLESRNNCDDSSDVRSNRPATHSPRLRHPSPAAPAADPPRPPTPPAGPPHDASPAPRTATPLRPDLWSGPGCQLPPYPYQQPTKQL